MAFRHILFPVDFSQRTSAAAKHVKAMAACFGSRITMVHAVEDPLKWYGATDPVKVVQIDLPKAIREKEHALHQLAEIEFPNKEVDVVAELAIPDELIERTAAKVEADLIMMPSRGQGRFRSALLGSTTVKVLHDLKIPVWTDVHCETAAPGSHLPVRRIVCAINLEPKSAAVLRCAAAFAKQWNAEMFVAHGVPVTELLLGEYREVDPPEYMEDFARSQIADLQREAGTSAEVWLESVPVADAARNAAQHHQADLMVIGRGKVTGLMTHAYSIIRESPCPVLSL
jgi:nucleotide-binding universal stress UspA family protein